MKRGGRIHVPKRKRRGDPRRFYIDRSWRANYFDTDFLNMRSIFSLVASQHDWFDCAACKA